MIELKYEKALTENKLSYDALPKNIKTGITTIRDWMKGIVLTEKRGNTPTQIVIDKIENTDEWVCKEIKEFAISKNVQPSVLDVEEAKKSKEIADKHAAEIVARELKEKEETERIEKEKLANEKKPDAVIQEDGRATGVDSELKVLNNAGKSSLTLQDIKSSAPNTYDILFDAYEVDGQNGIETSHYKLVETEKEIFTLTKK